ncbi:UDP-diphospho-muramoylpentapeptide beta-N-acetylglucosaminyltransferase [Thiopseudomonas alkaliphila]|uniref:undecaprenyldiphospho-muramoylpentapeptide beta-N-acetylglucosaminyltransferase n=1 Tax=Thiopseudomonas alkaliphila TaxID=1697053 RepID=UPI00069DF57C|nr:undecaprenyldiphospho-muramoylpentapeptide beta-N-acetylglucosaminyltransferase [Thiopseudomonas alkaliphila]AKX43734.1 UDP-diphospho-muramoylpentapeptide beta-N-acetylglucosaminyltransferase [Thiopseudomonas alkaliphila]AKX45991.1 UDP-diphospho-muramoylpentapeptide beta-N-acetylglucosaminyltransferase [Thiopseudomonas alkaliphila]AKX49075.1 UDP-diphospho-muramoylpentapeptide beta-N-acetylglucosaminyltransferase [Thiopseudomonas alkaliphila]AKX53030.1 UDP-diphospho-muramoylpentapeptide beta-
MAKPSVLIMAAGTGGHVFPALACARQFQQQGYDVHWLGTPTGIEHELTQHAGISMHCIQMSGLRGKGLARLLGMPWQLFKAILQARRVIKKVQPVCVVGFGGYVTVPGGVAAKLGGVPLVIHEQNAIAGTANKSLLPFAQLVCEGFPNTFKAQPKVCFTGNPVREDLLMLKRQLSAGTGVNLLVLGGSLGAEPLNKLLPEAVQLLADPAQLTIRHQAGKQHAAITQQRYQALGLTAEVQPFIGDMAAAYAWADLVICRAGALTVSELAAVGVGAFLIPLPHAIDDHQSKNAAFLAEQGAAKLLPQRSTTAEGLAAQLTEVLMNKHHLLEMGQIAASLAKPTATQEVVRKCLEVAHG